MLQGMFCVQSALVCLAQFFEFCLGYGGKAGPSRPCEECEGAGVKIRLRQIAPGMVQQTQTICPACRGAKEVIPAKDRCSTCNGNKVIREKKLLTVEIEKGMMVR